MKRTSSSSVIERLESLSDYSPGGYHPIHIGDELSHYTVIDKLGWGAYSTVWLATDSGNDGAFVVISVSKSTAEDVYRKYLIETMNYLSLGITDILERRTCVFHSTLSLLMGRMDDISAW